MIKRYFFLFIAGVLLTAGCADAVTQKETGDSIRIVTTFAPLYSFGTQVAGDLAEVTNLVPPGSSVHTWEPKPSDLRVLSEADLLIVNGLGLEPFIDDMIEAAGNPDLKTVVTAEAAQGKTMEFSPSIHLDEDEGHEDEGHEDEGHGHSHGGTDPHIWLNPELAVLQIESIRDILIQIDPDNADTYSENTQVAAQSLKELDSEIAQQMESATPKNFIVFHDAYGYFLKAYNLADYRLASIEAFPGREPSAGYFRKLVGLIKEKNVKVLFTEPQFNPRVAENLQQETGLKSFEINPIGLELSPKGYENNLRDMADTFLQAFDS